MPHTPSLRPRLQRLATGFEASGLLSGSGNGRFATAGMGFPFPTHSGHTVVAGASALHLQSGGDLQLPDMHVELSQLQSPRIDAASPAALAWPAAPEWPLRGAWARTTIAP